MQITHPGPLCVFLMYRGSASSRNRYPVRPDIHPAPNAPHPSMTRQHQRPPLPPLPLAASEQHQSSSCANQTIRPTLPILPLVPEPRSYRQHCGRRVRDAIELLVEAVSSLEILSGLPRCFLANFFLTEKPHSMSGGILG